MKTDVSLTSLASRFGQIVTKVDGDELQHPAVDIALRLVTDAAVLHLADVRAAAGGSAQVYRAGEELMLEWPRGGGYIDRRILSTGLADAIALHGGVALRESEWSAVVQVLRTVYGLADAHQVWNQFILDGREWWLDHLPPVLMGHVTREAVFQPLPRSALARRARLGRQS
jgi:hypothetical protein